MKLFNKGHANRVQRRVTIALSAFFVNYFCTIMIQRRVEQHSIRIVFSVSIDKLIRRIDDSIYARAIRLKCIVGLLGISTCLTDVTD